MTPETHWTLGVLIGLPIAGFLAFILLALTIASALAWKRDRRRHGSSDMSSAFWTFLGILLAVVVTSLVLFFPYKAEYHQWRPVSGTVAQIQSRLVSKDKGMEQKFVVRFTDRRQEYAVEDTRASLLSKGDKLIVSCKKSWQWAAAPGYDCRWIGSQEAAS